MRSDLNKLLCERERRHKGNFRQYRHLKQYKPDIDPEDGGHAGGEGMTRRYGYNGKDFNENLRPLYGQVRKAVGRRWDAFYSDLCKVFDMRSVINQHILQHLKDFCERDVYVKNGDLLVKRTYGSDVTLKSDDCEFYVDPRDGIIKRNKHRQTYRQVQRARAKEAAAKEALVMRALDDRTVLRKVGDVWFIFDVLPIPADGAFDTFLRKDVALSRYRFDSKTYHASRRTASHKLLKQHGLI